MGLFKALPLMTNNMGNKRVRKLELVLAWTKGGNYLVAELDGLVWREMVAAFRVLP